MASSDTIRTVVGIIGNATALGLFLSPVPTFYRILKKGSVEQFSPFPYLAVLLNCMMWSLYGLPLVHPHSILVLTINVSGTAIQLTYTLLFLLYSDGRQRLKVLALLLAELAFVGLVATLVLALAHSYERRSLVVGILATFFGTMMYASPLCVMKLVIDTKSVEFMPLFLSLASFLNAACWTAYALLRFDLYIIIPNGLGILFATAQLVLYFMFYKSTKKQTDARKKGDSSLAEIKVVVCGDTTTTTTTTTKACRDHQNGPSVPHV